MSQPPKRNQYNNSQPWHTAASRCFAKWADTLNKCPIAQGSTVAIWAHLRGAREMQSLASTWPTVAMVIIKRPPRRVEGWSQKTIQSIKTHTNLQETKWRYPVWPTTFLLFLLLWWFKI
jgi:hypothetical protein